MLRILTGMFLKFLELDLDLVLRIEVFPHRFCEVTQASYPHFTPERTGGTGGTEMLVNKGAKWTLGDGDHSPDKILEDQDSTTWQQRGLGPVTESPGHFLICVIGLRATELAGFHQLCDSLIA